MVTPIGLEKLGQLGDNLIHAKPLHFDGEVIGIMVVIFGDDAGTRASATALQGQGLIELTTMLRIDSQLWRGPDNLEVNLTGYFFLEIISFKARTILPPQILLTGT